MLSATEAKCISNQYNSKAKERTLKRIEERIKECAASGYEWTSWDFDYSIKEQSLTDTERRQIISELQSAGYNIEIGFFSRNFITIHW